MDYYEELGITPNATEEDIRRAHRRMTKLLHPDQHTDEGVKQLADVQMRRLNSIVDVLSDPELRREYDEQLREDASLATRPLGARQQRRKRPSWPWWIASTAGAVVLTLLVVWFWADNLGSSFGNRTPTYIPTDTKDAPASAAEVNAPPLPREPDKANVPASAEQPQSVPTQTPSSRTIVRAPLPSKTLAEVPAPRSQRTVNVAQATAPPPAEHKRLVLPNEASRVPARAAQVDLPPPPGLQVGNATRFDAATLPTTPLPPAPSRTVEADTPTRNVSYTAAPKPAIGDSLEGDWVYAPAAPEKKKAGFYPPEFIDLKLVREDGRLRGEYHARYQVARNSISPDVQFVLQPDNDENRFTWQGTNGTQGTFVINSVDPHVIHIQWRTTVFGRKPALTAGTATLVKRTQ